MPRAQSTPRATHALPGGSARLHAWLGPGGRGDRPARFLRRRRPPLQRGLTAATAPPASLRARVRARLRARLRACAARRGGARCAGAAQLGAAAGDAGHGPRGAAGPACRRPGGVDRRARAGRRSARGKRVPCREGRGGGMFRRRPSRYDRCLVTTYIRYFALHTSQLVYEYSRRPPQGLGQVRT